MNGQIVVAGIVREVLLIRHVDDRHELGTDIHPDVSNDADNLPQPVGRQRRVAAGHVHLNGLPDRITAGQELARECLVDDDHTGAVS